MSLEDSNDAVKTLDHIPQPSLGSPLPIIICNEHVLQLAFYTEPDGTLQGRTPPRMVEPDSRKEMTAFLRFHGYFCHMFGAPCDETLHGHPLARKGLRHYTAAEVRGSSWIKALERMNQVHPKHDPAFFSGLRHIVFPFHDSTLECIARDVEVTILNCSLQESASRMLSALFERI